LNRTLARIVAAAVIVAGSTAAQNRLAHFDGTQEFVSRGTIAPTNPKTVIQRVPWDQAGAATLLRQIVLVVQDQNAATPETIAIEVRTNNPALPGTPDMSAAGLLSSTGSFVVPFPIPIGPQAVILTVPFSGAGLALPTASGVPAGDWYICASLPAAPGFPLDGIYVGASGTLPGTEGEQMEPFSFGYTGIPNDSGLAWEYDQTTGALAEATVNRAWHMLGKYGENTLQPSAHSAAFLGVGTGTGLNPNYGYAGIWPHLTRVVGTVTDPDDVGFRFLTDLPIGTPVLLAAAIAILPAPISVGGAALPGSAKLCLDVNFMLLVQTVNTTAPPTGEPATSQALFGPYPGVGLDGLGPIYFQAAAAVGVQVKLSTMCKVVL
jgi:hypothetical protein